MFLNCILFKNVINIKFVISDVINEKINCIYSVKLGKNRYVINIFSVVVWVVLIILGEINLFFVIDCIIKFVIFNVDVFKIIVKVLGILEMSKILMVLGVNLNKVYKFIFFFVLIFKDNIINIIKINIFIVCFSLIIFLL